MEFSGTETIAVAPDRVFDFLTDPHQIAGCAPMMQDVRIKNPDEFDFKLSASGFNVGFSVRWTDRQRPHLALSIIEGGSRMMGRATLQNELRVSGNGAGPSQVDWLVIAKLSGMIGRMIDEEQLRSIVEKLNSDVIECARQKLE